MKVLMRAFLAIALLFTGTAALADQWVSGYTRDDGTQVQGHYRSSPNDTVTDNFTFKGNRNPYTGETGSNYYRDDSSSPYYDGSSNSYGNSNSYGTGTSFDNSNTFDNSNSFGNSDTFDSQW